jgi:hypothetical protein
LAIEASPSAQNWMDLRRPDGSLLFWLFRAGSVADLLGADEIRR